MSYVYDGSSGHNYIAFKWIWESWYASKWFTRIGWKWVNRLAPHAFVNYWWENDDFI